MPDRELARRIAWILSGGVPKRSPDPGAKGDEIGPDDGDVKQ